jgi:hypothetical protein
MIMMGIGIICFINGLAGMSEHATSGKWQKDLSVPAAAAADVTAETRPAVSSGPADQKNFKEEQAYLDRFGMIRFRDGSMSLSDFISCMQASPGFEKVLVFYEPFSFQRDRQRLQKMFEEAFPKARLLMQPIPEGSKIGGLVMPVNQPAVQSRVLSQQNNLDRRFFSHHRELVGQFQNYLTSVVNQITRISSEVSLRYREHHHLATQGAATQNSMETVN